MANHDQQSRVSASNDDKGLRITPEQALVFTTPVSDSYSSKDKRKQMSSPLSPYLMENKRSDFGLTDSHVPICDNKQSSGTPSMVESMFSPELMQDFAQMLAPTIATMVATSIEQSLSQSIQPLIHSAVNAAIRDNTQLDTVISEQVNAKVAPLVDIIQTQSSELQNLKTELGDLRTALEEQQQYSRRTALKFHNVPVPSSDISAFDTHQAVIDIARKIDVNISRNDLSRTHILGGVRNGKTTVIARFVRYSDRYNV
ncbi:uncharacterized protein LOC117338856 [Pecten maximus]|uniref:uncharacterized protein LOC117338856 n=1 Tax=Pecten maximus TaxID=6579 RepID=UPI001457FEBC|nr:uncharacterized protein LOC117338856 [Pecten maximus]